VLSKFSIRDLDSSAAIFADNFVWYDFNPNLSDVEGDYIGVAGLKNSSQLLQDIPSAFTFAQAM